MEIAIGEIVSVAFWISLAFSPILAGSGVWRKSSLVLVISALLSLPFAFIWALYPFPAGGWEFLALPGAHLLAAATVNRTARWISWFSLLLIVGFTGWFLLWRFILAT